MSNQSKRLYRSRQNRMISGVCGGIGEFFGIDGTIVRLTFALVTFVWPITPLVYLIMMLIVPEAPAGAAVQKETINTAESSNSDSSETP